MSPTLSIRLRLTLFFSTVLALTLVTFSTILYASQARATFAGIKSNLERQATRGFRVETVEPLEGLPAFGAVASPPEIELPSGTLMGRWTQTLNIDGTITGQTLDLSGASLPLSAGGLASVQKGAGWFEIATVQDEPLMIYSRLATAAWGEPEIVQVAFPIAQAQHSLATLRFMLIVGSSLAVLAAFGIGWALAGAALRPVHRITQTAQTIGAEHDFSRRVEHTGPADEVGQLAITFNQMLAELESGYRQLEGALQSQRRFVADASHELRTPLTTVRGNVELLGRDPPLDPKERADVLADTTGEVERLIRLVNQLLVLARADAGQALGCGRIPLPPLLEDVCRQAKLITARIPIVCEASDGAEALGDRDALKQVLLILIDNAHCHTAPGTRISVSARMVDGRAEISVRDAGPGISPELLPHIFERFYRGDASRSRAGAGLGLAIAKELVEQQRGTISVESEAGKGCVVTLSLPAPS